MIDWNQNRQLYQRAYEETGVSLKGWCQQNQVDYQSARKQINVKKIKEAAALTSPQTKRQNVIESQPQKANQTSFSKGNQIARKHGGYASLLNEDDVELALQINSLEDELLACRSRLVSAMKYRSDIEAEKRDCGDVEMKVVLSDLLIKVIESEERTIARIESLSATLSKLGRDTILLEKDKAQIRMIEQTIDLRDKENSDDEKVIYHIEW